MRIRRRNVKHSNRVHAPQHMAQPPEVSNRGRGLCGVDVNKRNPNEVWRNCKSAVSVVSRAGRVFLRLYVSDVFSVVVGCCVLRFCVALLCCEECYVDPLAAWLEQPAALEKSDLCVLATANTTVWSETLEHAG